MVHGRSLSDVTPQQLLEYALAKPGSWPDNPWGHEHPVVKVGQPGKIFLFVGSGTAGVKAGATRETADEWLDRYPGRGDPRGRRRVVSANRLEAACEATSTGLGRLTRRHQVAAIASCTRP